MNFHYFVAVIVVSAISQAKEISTKASDTDVVTLTDKAVEKMLFDGLRLVRILSTGGSENRASPVLE